MIRRVRYAGARARARREPRRSASLRSACGNFAARSLELREGVPPAPKNRGATRPRNY